MANKQIPALPPLDEAPADDDRFVVRDTSSGSDKSLRVDRFLERSADQVTEHAIETGGIHGIPEGERALHTGEEDSILGVFGGQFLHVQDQKPRDTDGGTFSPGAWRTRDLNTVLSNDITGASLENDLITLPAGVYYVEAFLPFYRVSRANGRVLNTSNDEVLISGANGFSSQATDNTQGETRLFGKFSLATTAAIEFQHRCQNEGENTGFGIRTGISDIPVEHEVYSDVRIWRISDE